MQTEYMQFKENYYDHVDLDDFVFDPEREAYIYPCPCGDEFIFTKLDLQNGEEIATCPSCSLIIKVVY
ncbi:Diphthamide biosynthesis protein 3 [Gurleya vavrai]